MHPWILLFIGLLGPVRARAQTLPDRATTIVVQLPAAGAARLRSMAKPLAGLGYAPLLLNTERLTLTTQPKLIQGTVGLTLRAVLQGNQALLTGGYMTLGVSPASCSPRWGTGREWRPAAPAGRGTVCSKRRAAWAQSWAMSSKIKSSARGYALPTPS